MLAPHLLYSIYVRNILVWQGFPVSSTYIYIYIYAWPGLSAGPTTPKSDHPHLPVKQKAEYYVTRHFVRKHPVDNVEVST